jgi:hypothetical protein
VIPNCMWCGTSLRAHYETIRRTVQTPNPNAGMKYSLGAGTSFTVPDFDTAFVMEKTGKIEGYGYMRESLFCTQSCGYQWAVNRLHDMGLPELNRSTP